MIRIQNMDAYWKDIQRIASALRENDIEVDEKFRSVTAKSIAGIMIYLDVERAVYKISDKEMDDAIRKELYRQIQEIEKRIDSKDENILKSFAAAHECCGGCV